MNTENETRDIGPHHCDGRFVLMHDREGFERHTAYPLHSSLYGSDDDGDNLNLNGRAVCACGYEHDFALTIPLPAGSEPDLNTLSLSHYTGHPLTLSFKDGHGMTQRINGPVFDLPEHADEDKKALTVAGDYPLHFTKLKIALPGTPIIEEGSWGSRELGKHDIQGTVWVRAPDNEGRARGGFEWYAGNGDDVYAGGGLWFRHGVLNDYDGVFSLADVVWLALHEAGYDVSGILTSHTSLKPGASQEEIEAKIFERDGRLRAKGYTVEVVE